jgi:hypothetical protein
MKKILVFCVLVAVLLTSCTQGEVVRANQEKAEQSFSIYRRVIFYNGINGEYILSIEGYLAIVVDNDGDLNVTVKTDDGKYLTHYLGISDNVTYFSEQLEASKVSSSHYRVIFKPSVLLPSITAE